MNKVISFNGVDGSGKTTQIDLLLERYSSLVEKIGNSESFFDSNINDFNWWFRLSTPKEFTDTIYQCIEKRNNLVSKSNKSIILLDKGLKNFDARVVATLMSKGVDEFAAKEMIKYAKEKYNIKNLETLSLFFEIAANSDERKKITAKRKFSELNGDDLTLYSRYQDYQNKIIQEQISNGEYYIFNATGTKEEVNHRLSKIILCNTDLENMDEHEKNKIYSLEK